MNALQLHQAALFNIGCNWFVVLLITLFVVGFLVWLANQLMPYAPVSDPFKAMMLKLIYVVAVAYVFLVFVQVIFGITIFNVTPFGCG